MFCRIFICLTMCVAATAALAEDNWPRFRGPNGSGVSESQHPPVPIDRDSMLRWKVAVPAGVSSPCVWGKHLFLTAVEDGKLWTLAYDCDNGHLLWRAEAPAKEIEKFHAIEGSPAASTCATDGQRVVSYFGSCGILCYDFQGHLLWKHELPVAQTHYDFGTGTSPILADGLVILVRDQKNAPAILALDAETGEERWKADRPNVPTAFSTPMISGQGKEMQLIVAGALRMKAYDLHSGKECWVLRGLPSANCTSPVTDGKRLYFAGWSPGSDSPMPSYDDLLKQFDANKDGILEKAEMEKSFLKDFFDANDTNHDGKLTRDEWDANLSYMKQGKNSLLAVTAKGEGDITDTAIDWKHTKGLPYVPSPLFYRGRIFLVRDGGLASCYDAEKGQTIYENRRLGASGKYYASPVAAGGYIFIVSLADGVISAIDAASDNPEVAAQRKLDERVAATPAIAGNRLYVRGGQHLYCFGAGE
ncbi:MAG TPA: PQQ-binding-like beta-propeller repeat protein [Pirellulales bacterium]|nr:PQQ-binding-like beta-propeller repeat protein [Pirellulales bacterium]